MEQQIAQLHMERDDLARSKQGLLAEFSIMNKKYVNLLDISLSKIVFFFFFFATRRKSANLKTHLDENRMSYSVKRKK